MILLPYLIFSHLLGDFVLQPSWLVKLKMRKLSGVVIHVLIHFIILAVVLSPFIFAGKLEVIWGILAVTGFHFMIDQAKISYDLKHDDKVRPFIIDQILHIIVIIVTALFLQDLTVSFPPTTFHQIYTSPNVITFLSILIFITEVIEIYKFQLEREKNSKAQLKINSKKVSLRVMAFTVLYIFFIALTLGADYFTG